MQGSARKDVVFGAAGVYTATVPGPKWKSWLGSPFAASWIYLQDRTWLMASRTAKKRSRSRPREAVTNGAALTAAAPGSPSVRPTPSGWIISPFWDTVLFIAAPLLSIGALFPLKGLWSSQEYATFLLAFLTFGHHLPGFIRAYGDHELFQRYRWRFVLAPPLLYVCVFWLGARGLHTIVMVTFTWDIWHVLMQHYGFMRIYDAKQREISAFTARMDLAFSLSCYIALIVASPHYRNNLLYVAYQSGVPLLPTQVFDALVVLIYTVACAMAAAYVAYTLYLWKQGRHNVRKLLTLATFVAATYYLYIYNDDFVVGFAVWSGFHCLQYYGIVWAFNRSRVDRSADVTRFVSFLFRPRTGLALLYVSLIFFYGGIDYLHNFLAEGTLRAALMTFIFTSTVLHYYYDGFIWKVREKDTSEPLNIEAAETKFESGLVVSSARSLASWLRRLLPSYKRGLYQAGYVAFFIFLLAWLEIWRPNDDLAMHRSLATVASGAEEAHLRLGESLRVRGRTEEAADSYRRAVEWNPRYAQAHVMLGVSLAGLGDIDGAIEALREALTIDPDNATGHFNLAALLEGRGETRQALHHYQQATEGPDVEAERLARKAILRLQSKQ